MKELTPPEKYLKILKNPNLFNLVTKEEFDKKIVGELETRQTIFLCLCGRHVLNNNIASYNLMINSASGSGKDFITKQILKIIPKTDYESRTRISPTTLTYWHCSEKEPNWTWDGKALYLEDVSNAVFNSATLKVMCSSGSKSTITVNNESKDFTINGKPVVILTSASANPKKDQLRRFPNIQLDESTQQTKEIIQRQAIQASKGITSEYNPLIQEALSYFKRVKVIIPFSEKIPKVFPSGHIIIRTHFERFLDFIKASAALHQYQRKKNKDGAIIAEGQDYDTARIALIKTTSNPLMVSISQDDQKILDIIKKLDAQKLEPSTYSISELESNIHFFSKYDTIKDHLLCLVDIGLLKSDKEERENSTKKVLVFSLTDLVKIEIPTFKELCRKNGIAGTGGISGIGGIGGITNSSNSSNSGQNLAPEKEVTHKKGGGNELNE